MPTDAAPGPAIPLADIAGRWLADLARLTGSPAIAALDGATLLGERAWLNGFCVPGQVSAGGGCRLMQGADGGWIALNLARPDDRELLPALFGDAGLDRENPSQIARAVANRTATDLIARGRELGLAIAGLDEPSGSPACEVLAEFAPSDRDCPAAPLVIDLSALWAGPLAGHLLWLAGARVVKVEAPLRPDAMRNGDSGLFALLNQGKDSVAIDLRCADGRAGLLRLLALADVVIEAARPRALEQLGIDAASSLRTRPGQVWISITAHGARAPQRDAVGFGDDCGVAGGLSRALLDASGQIAFVGDAIADPLTGIAAARAAWAALRERRTCRIALSMSATAAAALAEARTEDGLALDASLRDWADAMGRPFPAVPVRQPLAKVRPFGADTHRWLAAPAC